MNVSLLRDSFDLVVANEPALTQRFYAVLFQRYPQTRKMFPANRLTAQSEMLQGALGAVLDHLEDAAWLASTLGALGAKHVGYGVTPEMYDWVGDSLLATLAEVAGEAWTFELCLAWSEAYGAIATMMQAGVTPQRAAAPQMGDVA